MNRDDYLNSAMNAQQNYASEEYRNRLMNQSSAYYREIEAMMNSRTEIIDYRGSRLGVEYNPNHWDYKIGYRVRDLATGLITNHIREWADNPRDLMPEVIQEHFHMVRSRPDYQHSGPVNQELQDHPALAQAWSEYQVVRRLLGLKTD